MIPLNIQICRSNWFALLYAIIRACACDYRILHNPRILYIASERNHMIEKMIAMTRETEDA